MNFLVFIIVFVLIAINYIVIISLSSASLSSVKTAQKDPNTPAEDQAAYKAAAQYLGWSIAVGWTIFAIAVIVIIIAIVLLVIGTGTGVTEAGAAAAEGTALAGEAAVESETLLSQAKNIASQAKGAYDKYNAMHDAARILKTGPKEIKEGLFGFNNFFNGKTLFGKVEIAAIVLMLGANFAFGILAAEAAAKINSTTTKAGYTSAIWATILGIVPFAIVVIWWFANIWYVHGAKARYNHAEELVKENRQKAHQAAVEEHKAVVEERKEERKEERQKIDDAIVAGVASGSIDPIKGKQALEHRPPPPRRGSAPPSSGTRGRPPPKSSSGSSISSLAGKAQQAYGSLTPAQQAQLKQAGSDLFNTALKAISSSA